jgi:leader peptidase (prepilin peptidase)/N-methyltransferase
VSVTVLYGFIFLLGTVVGSFLNVCIWRIPAGKSIIFPASSCPDCKAPIRWHQNIPVISYLLLGRKCAACRAPISFRYPLVEILTGFLFAVIVYRFGVQYFTPVLWLLGAVLIVVTFIDIDHQIIPNLISLPGIGIGFLCSFIIPWVSWTASLLGILIGGGSLYLVAMAYEWLTKKEGMGGGDIKLLAMIGAFLGWKAILPIIFMSSLIGSAVGVPLMLLKKADGKLAIPFGPFLSLGTLVYLLWGPSLIRWYLSLFQGG